MPKRLDRITSAVRVSEKAELAERELENNNIRLFGDAHGTVAGRHRTQNKPRFMVGCWHYQPRSGISVFGQALVIPGRRARVAPRRGTGLRRGVPVYRFILWHLQVVLMLSPHSSKLGSFIDGLFTDTLCETDPEI